MNLLTPQQTADFLQVSPRTLRQWRHMHSGPPFIRLGASTFRYELESLKRYVEGRTVTVNREPCH